MPLLPRIANFDDFDPLRAEPGVRLMFAPPGAPLPPADLIILPGRRRRSPTRRCAPGLGHRPRSPMSGAAARCWASAAAIRCSAAPIADPEGIEGPPATVAGLGLLDVETVLGGDKTLTRVAGHLARRRRAVRGYEIHVGRTAGADAPAAARIRRRARRMARVIGGRARARLLRPRPVRRRRAAAAWLAWIGAPASALAYEAEVEATLDALAEHLERHVRVDAMLALAR